VRRAKRHGEWVDRLLRRRARHAAPASNVVVDGSFTACLVKGSTLLDHPNAKGSRESFERAPVREISKGKEPKGPPPRTREAKRNVTCWATLARSEARCSERVCAVGRNDWTLLEETKIADHASNTDHAYGSQQPSLGRTEPSKLVYEPSHRAFAVQVKSLSAVAI